MKKGPVSDSATVATSKPSPKSAATESSTTVSSQKKEGLLVDPATNKPQHKEMNQQGFSPRFPPGHPRFRPPRGSFDADNPKNFGGPPDAPQGRGFPRMMNPRGPPGPLLPRGSLHGLNSRMPESLMGFPRPPDQFQARGSRPMGNMRGELRPERPNFPGNGPSRGPLPIRGPRDPLQRSERPPVPSETPFRGRNPEMRGQRHPGPRFPAPTDFEKRGPEQSGQKADKHGKPDGQFLRESHSRDGDRHIKPDQHHSSGHHQSRGHHHDSPGNQHSPESAFVSERPVWADGPRSTQDTRYKEPLADDGRRNNRPLWDDGRGRKERDFDREGFDRNKGDNQAHRSGLRSRGPEEFEGNPPPYFHGERDRQRNPQKQVYDLFHHCNSSIRNSED